MSEAQVVDVDALDAWVRKTADAIYAKGLISYRFGQSEKETEADKRDLRVVLTTEVVSLFARRPEPRDTEERPEDAARRFASALERIRANWPHIEVANPRHWTDKHTTDPGSPACLRCKIEALIREPEAVPGLRA